MNRASVWFVWALVLFLVKAVYSIELSEMQQMRQMSLASNRPTNTTIIRHKRYLDFIHKSRMFFRNNIKANVLAPPNQLLAFAYGFRANYPIENDIKIKRRDVYDTIEEMMHHNGFDGSACISKLLCDASSIISPESGIFMRLYQLIFRFPQMDNELYAKFNAEDCERHTANCPLKLLKLTPYTDF